MLAHKLEPSIQGHACEGMPFHGSSVLQTEPLLVLLVQYELKFLGFAPLIKLGLLLLSLLVLVKHFSVLEQLLASDRLSFFLAQLFLHLILVCFETNFLLKLLQLILLFLSEQPHLLLDHLGLFVFGCLLFQLLFGEFVPLLFALRDQF